MTGSALLELPATATRSLWVARVSGDQVAMGRQHAGLLSEVGGWEHLLDYYERMPELVLGGPREGERTPPLVHAIRPLVALALRSLEGRRPRELRARSRAFFAALGRPPETSQHQQVMDVLQNVINLAGRFGLGPSRQITARAVPSCTSLAVWGRASATGGLLHARNFDFPGAGVWERAPAVVFCEPREAGSLRYGFVTTRGADVAGVSTFNEAGISLTSHTRFHRHARLFDGVGIVDLCHEIARKARTLADAIRIARRRPASSTWGLLVSSAREERALVLEITARRVEVVEPSPGEDFLANTNRYVSENLQPDQVAPSTGFVKNSDGRLEVARRWGQRGGLSVADLQACLDAYDDPDHPGETRAAGGTIAQAITVQSVVIDPIEEVVHVSVGPVPTGQGPYVTVPWRWSQAADSALHEVESAPAPPPPGRAGYLEAVRLHGSGGQRGAIEEALARAVTDAPEDPTYRLLAGGCALRRHDFPRAREHFARGLEAERSPFHRGQLLLWASRAASCERDRAAAKRYREELERLEEPLVADYQRELAREARRGFPRRLLSRIDVHPGFPDVTVL